MKRETKGWSAERRAKQAENIHKTKPWQKATGPKTEDGKAAVKNNAYKHGWRSEDMREVYRLLRAQRQYVRDVLRETLDKRRPE